LTFNLPNISLNFIFNLPYGKLISSQNMLISAVNEYRI
jgi:hypothetical protein